MALNRIQKIEQYLPNSPPFPAPTDQWFHLLSVTPTNTQRKADAAMLKGLIAGFAPPLAPNTYVRTTTLNLSRTDTPSRPLLLLNS
jgi:hypothetical protein